VNIRGSTEQRARRYWQLQRRAGYSTVRRGVLQEKAMKRYPEETAKVTIIVERNGVKTRYKKRFKKGEAMLGRISDFMIKIQEDKPDEMEG
jgi:hypothetical protein